MKQLYSDWLSTTDNVTASGNLRPPTRQDITSWVKVAWERLSPDLLRKSYTACGFLIENEEDLSSITCLKENSMAKEIVSQAFNFRAQATNQEDPFQRDQPAALEAESDDDLIEI